MGVVVGAAVLVGVTVPVVPPDEELLVLTDRDSDAGAPVPVAVNVTLCEVPSHGTAILPTPVTGKPAAAGNG